MRLSSHCRLIGLFAMVAMSILTDARAAQETMPEPPCTVFAASFTEAFNQQNYSGLVKHFHFTALSRKIGKTMYDDKKDVRDYMKGFAAVDKDTLVERLFRDQYRMGGHIRYLRCYENTSPMMRISYAEGGYEYMIFETIKNQDSLDRISDIYFLSNGNTLSQAIGGITQALMQSNKSFLQRLLGVEQIEEKSFSTLKEVNRLYSQGELDKAYNEYQKLPLSMRKQRLFIGYALKISVQMSDESHYYKQLELLDQYHGRDTSAGFMLIDHYLNNRQFNKAHRAIDRLIDKYGEDGGTLMLKGTVYLFADELDQARVYARKTTDIEPNFEDGYWFTANVSHAQADFRAMVKAYQTLEEFGYEFDEAVFEDSQYDDFRKSSAYRNWLTP